MKTIAATLVLMALAACAPAPAPEAETTETEASVPETADAQIPSTAVRHVVVFKFRPDAEAAQIQQVTDAFRDLQTKIPGIVGFEHGVNDSPEGKNLGFTHVYTLTFADAAARDAYLPHPDHQAFGTLLRGLGIHEDTFVVDYSPAS